LPSWPNCKRGFAGKAVCQTSASNVDTELVATVQTAADAALSFARMVVDSRGQSVRVDVTPNDFASSCGLDQRAPVKPHDRVKIMAD
jgi:hypothetical protein